MVLSVAGYGRRMSWKEETTIPPGHKLTFTNALTTVTNSLLLKVLLPNWALGLTKGLRKIRLSFNELDVSSLAILLWMVYRAKKKQYLSEMISERRRLMNKEDKCDLLTSLIRGSEDDDIGEFKLSYSELTG